jgi:hypothetical protein
MAGKALSDLIYEKLKSQAPGPGPSQAEVADGRGTDGMEQTETMEASKEGDSDPLARGVVGQDAPEASSPEACKAEEELQESQMPVEPVQQLEERHDHEDYEPAKIEKEIEVSTDEPGPVDPVDPVVQDPVSYPTLAGPAEAVGESVDDAQLPADTEGQVEEVEAPAPGLGDEPHLTDLKQSSATSEQEPKESCVYPASSMLQMRLTMPSKGATQLKGKM